MMTYCVIMEITLENFSEIISGLDCDYVAFAANGKIFKADFETAVNNAVYSLKKTDVKPGIYCIMIIQ